MADVEKARAELNRIEAFLRTRYHYPHPIFGHMAAALEYLGEPPPAGVEAPAEAEAEEPGVAGAEALAEAASTVPAYEPPAEPEPSARRGRKRGQT